MNAVTSTAGARGRERVLAIGTIMAVIAALMLVFASPARAHNVSLDHSCYGWSVDLTAYNTSGDNSVKITVDSAVIVDLPDFGRNYTNSGTWDPTEDHTILINVRAHDDPGLQRGWSFDYEASEDACEEPTTTVPETTSTTVETTTTVPETTSTTEETSTTVPETTSTTEETTTTVTVAPTSITSPPTTAEVLPTSITSAPPTTVVVDPVDTLPFTGVESGTPALLALALIGIGALALVATRRAED